MEKEANVVAVEENSIRVRFMRHSACAKCGACNMGENSEKEITLEKTPELNGLHLKPGDQVRLAIDSTAFLRAVSLVYLLPLALFFVGYLIGYGIFTLYASPGWEEGGGVIIGFAFLALSYLGINRYDRHLTGKERYRIRIRPQDLYNE